MLVVLAVVGIAPGPLRALLIAGPVSTFALPWLGAVAEWRLGVGFRRRGGRPGATSATVALVAVGTAVALLGTQALAWRVRPGTMLGAGSALLAWPWLMPHGALAFVGFVQLSTVSEARGRLAAARPAVGGAALAACFAAAALLATALVDWSAVSPPPAAPRWHGGPVPAFDLLTWLACTAASQVLYGLLGGWPVAAIGRRRLRIAAANALVLGCATLAWAALRHGLDLPGPRIAAGCALWVAGGVMAARAAGRRAEDTTWAARAQALLLAACYAVVLGLTLTAVAALQDWPAGTPAELWLVVCGLNLVPATVLAAEGMLRAYPRRRREAIIQPP